MMTYCDRCGEATDTGCEYCSPCLSVLTVLDVPELAESCPWGELHCSPVDVITIIGWRV